MSRTGFRNNVSSVIIQDKALFVQRGGPLSAFSIHPHSRSMSKIEKNSAGKSTPPITSTSSEGSVCRVQGDFIPSYSHPGDAGADLRSATDATIPARGSNLIPTGIRVELPPGHVGLVWPRSGLAVKHSLDCGAGVIDSQYRGEIKVLLFNHSDENYEVKRGDRIAQLLIQKVESVQFIKVQDIDDTLRGGNGFGSTGNR